MTRKPYPSEEAARFQVRLPEGLRDQIKDLAEKSGRSMNSEIVIALEQYLSCDSSENAHLSRIEEKIDILYALTDSKWRRGERLRVEGFHHG